ncbi:uncharacterized protein EDB93DRAFT_1249344 [Suillus bovinus]|uniref:uncharacterized protein n=1 Tax=Suillus bovinus TaxID=48563 RepID=UPI001B884A91|nr:uncharacterized protein EDB93DRAFT_1249344 [Suillus bovinus]KAG2151152.1 hypothetical protein EDB93DRAFT_1249344 [Suillus bovinus]
MTGSNPSELKSPQDIENELAAEAPPPSYYNNTSEQDAVAGASSSSSPLQPAFKSKPTNYLHLFNENSSVKGQYVIDPGMSIPTSLLPPLSPEESEADRKNLSLHSKNGSVNAEIWLLGAQDAQPFDSKKPTKRTILDIGSENGSITARVHTTHRAAPFLLNISASNGAVNVSLPRSFNGLLLLTTKHGSVSLSDTLSENCTHLSQVDLTRRYFVGDFSTLDDSDWPGDELRVEGKHGKIRIRYVEEHTSADDTSKGGLLSRLFGW